MTPRRLTRSVLPACILCAFIIALTAAAPAAGPKWDPTRTTAPESIEELKILQESVKRVVEKCSPATVGILIGAGAGSGVIVSDDGLVLTAAHVSGDPGKDCTLILPDGKRVKGKTLGTNDRMDSGMIRITDKGPNAGKWPFVPTGKSADLKKGQWVVALGHPGGFKKDRPPVARLGQVLTSDKDLIRTNCTLVGGDSGGPLFDLTGKVVGIHSRIGLSLAQNIHVPLDAFKTDWDKLVKGEIIGKPTRPSAAVLGVEFDDKADDARLAAVVEDGPAAEAGFKAGDVITKFDGSAVTTADDVRGLLRKRKPGDEIKVIVKRDGKTLTLTVTLGKRGS